MSLTMKFGSLRVGTRFARSPNRALSTLAISSIDTAPP
jgi:hypothetical protein